MYIGSQPSDRTSGAKPRDEFVGDGSTVNFTLSQEVPGGFESNVLVIVDNVLQQPVESYTIAGDNITLAFSEAPASGAMVYVLHQGTATYQMIPVVGSVTPDKLSENLRNFTVDTFTGNGSTTAYTLTSEPASANSILVIVDGIVQTRTTNYTLSGTTLTFTSAPDNSSSITVIHLGFSTVSRTAVPDGSITTAKIADNAITSAKIAFDVIVAEDIAANAITVSELQNGAVTPAKLSTGGPSWDTSGNLGIGTASPGFPITVNSSSAQIAIQNATTGSSSADGSRFQLLGSDLAIVNREAASIQLYTSDTERMRIDSGGTVLFGTTNDTFFAGSNIGVGIYTTSGFIAASRNNALSGLFNRYGSDGELVQFRRAGTTVGSIDVTTTGTTYTGTNGITFTATQTASANANTLDDYEEGDWTPSLGGNTTFTSRSGRYVKIGKLVSVLFDIQVSVLGTGNANQIINLPFTAEANSITNGGSIGFFSGLATSVVSMFLRIDGGGSSIIVSGMTGAGTAINTNTIFQNNTRFTGCITYITSA